MARAEKKKGPTEEGVIQPKKQEPIFDWDF